MKKLILFFSLINTIQGLSQESVSPLDCVGPFYHGVASGDPLSDRVIIWTRVTPNNFSDLIPVSYRVATDTGMVNIVAQGSILTSNDKDFTVKADVTGLDPNTFYYYEFQFENFISPRGRTKTTPIGAVNQARFAVVSCANLESGHFNVYEVINQKNDVDAVLMLGDYIYEYETNGYGNNSATDRTYEPETEIISLEDYRLRYSVYRMDRSLQTLHQNFPWICIWDDHESANDSHKEGAENHNAGEGDWQQRKLNAQKAYFEWLPIREKEPGNYEIFRKFEYGNLLDLFMIDTRLHGRDAPTSNNSAEHVSSHRSMLGDDQYLWLKNELQQSTAQYKVLGNQVIVAPINVFGIPINLDAWDGFPAQRQNLFDFIQLNSIDNFVVLTGDVHTSWAFNLENGSNHVGVEFVTPSVTSPGAPLNVGDVLTLENSHIKYVELTKKGFIILDVTPQKIQADWFYVATLDEFSADFNWGKSMYSNSGENQLNETTTVSIPGLEYMIDRSPTCPRVLTEDTVISVIEENKFADIVGIYPNPVVNELIVHITSENEESVDLEIIDSYGKTKHQENMTLFKMSSLNILSVNVAHLSAGVYVCQLKNNRGVVSSTKFVKK